MTDVNSTKRIQKKEDFLIIMNQIRLFDAKDVSLVSLELHTPEILKEQKLTPKNVKRILNFYAGNRFNSTKKINELEKIFWDSAPNPVYHHLFLPMKRPKKIGGVASYACCHCIFRQTHGTFYTEARPRVKL